MQSRQQITVVSTSAFVVELMKNWRVSGDTLKTEAQQDTEKLDMGV